MRRINSKEIAKAIEKLVINANYYLGDDIKEALKKSRDVEQSDTGKDILSQLIENADIAKNVDMPICQDTGMVVVFIDIGQEVFIEGDLLEESVNQGIRIGYQKGYLRNSVVIDPINRINTNDNTPGIIHINIVKGNKIKIDVAPKGFGSENMSRVKMLKPSDGIDGVKEFIIETVSVAGSNPCPPIIIGVGIGGTMEKAAIIAKKALLRPIDAINPNNYYRLLEEELLKNINKLGIGPGGIGGTVTALGINIEAFPTHIAGLPVAVNISCHATRHASITI